MSTSIADPEANSETRRLYPTLNGLTSQQNSIKEIFKAEFTKKNLSLAYTNESVFYKSQWEWPPIIFITYRIIIAVYISAWLIYSMVKVPVWLNPKGREIPWAAFLTNWSYTVLSAYLILAAAIAVCKTKAMYCFSKPAPMSTAPEPYKGMTSRNPASTEPNYGSHSYSVSVDIIVPPERPLHWYAKIEWVLFAIISNVAFIVTVLYWGVLFPHEHKKGRGLVVLNIHLHAVNSLVIIIEMFLTAFPVRLVHAIYPLMYGLTYIVFSLFYWAADHNNVVYVGVLDWNTPGMTILVILVLIFGVVPLTQLLLFGLYKLRVWMYNTIYVKGMEVA